MSLDERPGWEDCIQCMTKLAIFDIELKIFNYFRKDFTSKMFGSNPGTNRVRSFIDLLYFLVGKHLMCHCKRLLLKRNKSHWKVSNVSAKYFAFLNINYFIPLTLVSFIRKHNSTVLCHYAVDLHFYFFSNCFISN